MPTIQGTLLVRRDGAIVHVELPPLPSTMEVAGRGFQVKSEFHVTLLGREILARAGLLDVPRLDVAIRRAARGAGFLVEILDDLRLVTRGDAASVIRMCRVDGAEEFFLRFESATGSSLPRPPYHLTLYTSGTRKGIGLCSSSDLESHSRPLDPQERHRLLSAIT